MKEHITPSSGQHIDSYVGERLRLRRRQLGFSQEQLAEKVGISFQQLQKYERGINRITAGRLMQIAQLLSTPISFFFNKFDVEELFIPPEHLQLSETNKFEIDSFYEEKITSQEIETIKQLYAKIQSKQARNIVGNLVAFLARQQS